VTCATDEELRLILKTMNAHGFNLAENDVAAGVHDIVVQAKAEANVNFDDANMAGAEAFAAPAHWW
jgi:glycine cleavage system protein P-like pyridoxal-binding family